VIAHVVPIRGEHRRFPARQYDRIEKPLIPSMLAGDVRDCGDDAYYQEDCDV
jgi:hypothetical protein